jgi:monoterpene epsilon-lactone hydrolase
MFGHLAKATGARALIFDYRLAPAHTHPAQVDDATTVVPGASDRGHEPVRTTAAGSGAAELSSSPSR